MKVIIKLILIFLFTSCESPPRKFEETRYLDLHQTEDEIVEILITALEKHLSSSGKRYENIYLIGMRNQTLNKIIQHFEKNKFNATMRIGATKNNKSPSDATLNLRINQPENQDLLKINILEERTFEAASWDIFIKNDKNGKPTVINYSMLFITWENEPTGQPIA